MELEIYKGQFVNADDAKTKIDVYTIKEGCTLLKRAVEKIENVTRKIDILRSTCNREALSIGEKNMEETIEVYEKETRELFEYLDELAESINKTAELTLKQKQQDLNNIAQELDKREIAIHRSQPNANIKEMNITKEEYERRLKRYGKFEEYQRRQQMAAKLYSGQHGEEDNK